MNASQRLALALLLLLAIVVVSGLWIASRLSAPNESPPIAATATSVPTAVVTPTATALRAPPGYRLAGVAIGEPESYAAIEAPNGASALYHVNAEIPGLGRLVHIEAERVVIESATGQFDLWIAPAATLTPTPIRTRATPIARARPSRRFTPVPTPQATPTG